MSIRVFWGLLTAVGVFLTVGPVISKPLDFDDVLASAKLSEVDWIATDARLDYLVDRDDAGHFVVQVSEAYTANFTNGPEAEIRRAFVTEFSGRHTRFELHSVTVDGQPARVTVNRGPSTTRVTVGRDDGSLFEGRHEIGLEYEMRDLAVTELDAATGLDADRWWWPVLGPSWPQATKGVEVSLTLAPELDESLVRAPRATVGWLLLSATVWLTPDDADGAVVGASGVRYSFSNNDTLPPHPELSIDTRFAAGTFTQPATTPLFWLQSWGPLIPLALLGVLLVFALAARRVVWADSAGEPWYLPRAEPPTGLSALGAAQLLGKPWHAELIEKLSEAPREGVTQGPQARRSRERWLAQLARVGMRLGRLGNFPTVARYRSRWARADTPVRDGLRWVPKSYLRDTFILGSIAITAVQWGLLRQLSEQVVLTVIWWPGLFVLTSTVLAAAIVAIVARPRPLTREGALCVQQLKGIEAWAEATRLFERGPINDALVPYAALFERPRRAGRAVAELAEREAGDRSIGRGWRTEHFVSLPAVVAVVAGLTILAGSIVTAATMPAPYASTEFVTWPGSDLAGEMWTQNEGIDISARLVGDGAGGARLEVTERNDVRFTPGGNSVPQYTREWPSERFGRSLGLEVASVHIDGELAPFRTIDGAHTTALHTQLPTVLDGLYEVEVVYSLANPVVGTSAGVQQMRWAALLRIWDDFYYTNTTSLFEGRALVRPVRVQFEVAPEIAGQVTSGGWIASDYDREQVPHESGNWFGPWQYETRVYDDSSQAYELRIGASEARADGSFVATLDADQVESYRVTDTGANRGEAGEFAVDGQVNAWLGSHELRLHGDVGAVLNFAPGTFSGVAPDDYERDRAARALPYALMMGIGALIAAAAVSVFVFALRVKRRPSASLATLAFAALPLAAIGHAVFFWWQIGSMSGSDARGGFGLVLGGVLWVGVIVQSIAIGVRLGSAARQCEEGKGN